MFVKALIVQVMLWYILLLFIFIFIFNESVCLSALQHVSTACKCYTSCRQHVCPSVYLSCTDIVWEWHKQISQNFHWWIGPGLFSFYQIQGSSMNSKKFMHNERIKRERSSGKVEVFPYKLLYLWNGARWDPDCRWSLIWSHIHAFDCYRNQLPWMTEKPLHTLSHFISYYLFHYYTCVCLMQIWILSVAAMLPRDSSFLQCKVYADIYGDVIKWLGVVENRGFTSLSGYVFTTLEIWPKLLYGNR